MMEIIFSEKKKRMHLLLLSQLQLLIFTPIMALTNLLIRNLVIVYGLVIARQPNYAECPIV